MIDLIGVTRDGLLCGGFAAIVAGIVLLWAWRRMGEDD